MASKCNKFLPNIFNKSKCQHCFAAKEAHSAAALENNKASRKVTKCGYLFVSPGYDFSNPLDRTRRWQRRLFRLYDDGELTYSVDENPDTVPQGVVDMNKCTDVLDAQQTTTHPNSLAVITPERTVYIKSTSREEIQWWQDTLAEFPKALKAIKPRRKQPFLILSNKENQEEGPGSGTSDGGKLAGGGGAAGVAPYSTFRGVRSMKHRSDPAHQDGLRKSSSLHDLSSTGGPGADSSEPGLAGGAGSNLSGSRFLSRSGDRLDVLGRREKSFSLSSSVSPPREQRPGLPVLPHPPAFTMPRSTWTRTGQPVPPAFLAPAPLKLQPASTASSSSSLASSTASPRRSSFDDRPPPSSASAATSSSRGIGAASAAESRRVHRERSASLKEFPTGHLSLMPQQHLQEGAVTTTTTSATGSRTASLPTTNTNTAGGGSTSDPGSVCSMSADETDSNETDELKDLYMKKGWLIKQGPTEKESKKHWFVLGGNSLRYYQDAKSEEGNMLDGRIDLSTCYEVSELPTHRNYGFKIKTGNGETTLAAMTMGIRNNWMKAIRLCMELHNTDSRRTSRASPAHSKSPPRASLDDLEFKSGAAASSTAAVTGAGGETGFQLIGRRDPHKRDTQKPARRHHSDVNPGNVSSALSVREFPVEIDTVDGYSNRGGEIRPGESLASSRGSTRSVDSQASAKVSSSSSSTDHGVDPSLTPRASKIARHRSPSTDGPAWSAQRSSGGDSTSGGRYVEGSDSVPGPQAAQSIQQGKTSASGGSGQPKRSVASESSKEAEVKREMMRRAKSPSARVRDKTRGAKTPRLHPPAGLLEKGFAGYHQHHHPPGSATASDTGSAMSDTADDPAYADVHMSEDDYATQEDTDIDEVGSATASDVVGGGDEALVEILETEVESLKDRLEHTQTELDQVHKDNLDLKSRLQKEATQSVDSGYSASSRWGQQSDAARYGQTSSTSEVQALKRQLKDSRDTVQRQRMEIDGLKSRLDMSVSKLTGTEKALSEALRDYKQEKDKFMKLSSEWNRRIRTMEGQHKDTVHKLELSRESLQAKEREGRRLEAEVKTNLQKTREQEREILKLKAVEHEYKQLKEKLDDREQELLSLRAQLKEKDQWGTKQQEECERRLEVMEREYRLERDDLEHHLEQLKGELYTAHDRQASLSDNMTLNMADMLRDKDDIIAQLEEKLIEADKKMVDLSEELHAEMGENADLSHSLDSLRQDKQGLSNTISQLEAQLLSVRTKVQGFESDNFSLRRQLEELRVENTQLHDGLVSAGGDRVRSAASSPDAVEGEKEREKLKGTIVDLNLQIEALQHQIARAGESLEKPVERGNSTLSTVSSVGSSAGERDSLASSSDHQQDLLHTVVVLDSQLREVNAMLLTLRQSFDAYLGTLEDGQARAQGNRLADLIEDIGHKCHELQDTLRETPGEEGGAPEYKHVITVGPASGASVIMKEYKGLKLKFDQAVAELRKVRRDVTEAKASYETVKTEDRKLKEMLGVMEGAYKQQMVELIARVDGLSEKIVNVQSGSSLMDSQTSSPPAQGLPQVCNSSIQQIEDQLNQLEARISSLEQQARSAQASRATGASGGTSSPAASAGLMAELGQVRTQLEEANAKLQTVSSILPSQLLGKVESCKERIGSLSASLQQPAPSRATPPVTSGEAAAASAGVSSCLSEIREQVREIGEQLDSLEEGDEDSDSEDEEEQTTVEELREKLSHLTEYIEEHSKLSTSDWALLRLMQLQKANLAAPKDTTKEPMETDNEAAEEKLKVYADRISLEAVLLYEVAHILQSRDCLSPEDSVCREIDCLNNQLLSLHQKLDTQMKTMHFEDPQADLLSSYVELMAEKILINGQIFANSFDQRSHLGKVTVESSSSVQPVILATEALVRSQIDSFISSNMDCNVSEIMTLPTHLSLRAVVQGELTYALAQLKSRLEKTPEVLQPGPANYKFAFDKLLERQRKVFASIENYESQLTNSLAVIIFKESEEMTIVEGPESVLEAMCSDLSTILETHIQVYKEKCRSALDTHSAHKFDLTVNELRHCREAALLAIKSQHEAYARDPTSVRDSSLDIPVQSLDSTISSFGEILSLKAIVAANSHFLLELLKMGSSVLADVELEHDSPPDDSLSIEKGLTTFVNALTEVLETEALSKAKLSRQVSASLKTPDRSVLGKGDSDSSGDQSEGTVITAEDLHVPDLTLCPGGMLSPQAQVLVREAVFGCQLSLSLFKQKLLHEREMQRCLKAHRPLRAGRERPRHSNADSHAEEEAGHDSDGTLDLQNDFQALLVPLEEVLESKHEDELEVLQVLLGLVSQITSSQASPAGLEDQLRQLEQKLQHELGVAQERHATHLEVFKQESQRVEKNLEEQACEREHFEERTLQLEEELGTLQLQHEEEKERVKQDILTAVHAIRSNEEKSETNLAQKATKLGRELAVHKLNFRKILGSIKTDAATKDKSSLIQNIEEHIKGISLNPEEEEDDDYQPPLPSQPPPVAPAEGKPQTVEEDVVEPEMMLNLSHHEHEVEQLKKEKDEALAEEMRNTKAALDAVRSAYEDELAKERAKYKEALLTMYTEEYINEIRMRHLEEEDRMREELQKVNMHYSSKCEDYKLMEMKLGQTKHDFESHINQLIASNDHLEGMLNTEIESLKEFIKHKPSSASLTTGSATMEEELYDSKIMVRVKDAELQKLRSQVKNLENSLHRTTEEQRQTMTQYMQALKKSGEMKNQYQEEVSQLTEKLHKVLGSQGLKANIRRTPSFHQRARSPSPQAGASPRKETTDHSSRDSHRRRHIPPKDLRRSKSSPSLPYVFDGKISPAKLPSSGKLGRRSRSPKT